MLINIWTDAIFVFGLVSRSFLRCRLLTPNRLETRFSKGMYCTNQLFTEIISGDHSFFMFSLVSLGPAFVSFGAAEKGSEISWFSRAALKDP